MKKVIRGILRGCRYFLYVCMYRFFGLFPIKKNKIFIVSYGGKGYGDNGKYIVEALLSSGENYEIFWSVKDLNAEMPQGIKKVKYFSVKAVYHEATAKVWIDNTRKESWVRKRKKQFYIQTWHGDVGMKKVEKDTEAALPPLYVKAAKHDSKMADLFVSGNEWTSRLYRSAFWYDGEIAKVGYPRRDILYKSSAVEGLKEKVGLPKEAHVLLYAPTFRSHQMYCDTPDLSVYKLPWTEVLAAFSSRFGGEWIGALRLHPNVSKFAKELQLPDGVYNVTDYADMQELLAVADACISDYSSSPFDFSVTGKPSFIYATDYEAYKKDRDTYFTFEELPFPLAQTKEALLENITCFDEEAYAEKHRQFYEERIGLYEEGNASQRIVDRIREICQGVSQK